jgi:hypothetical protein
MITEQRELEIRMAKVLVVVALVACGPKPVQKPALPPAASDITLYRGLALVRQRVEIDASGTETSARVKLPAGVSPSQVIVVDRGGLVVHGLSPEGSDLVVAATAPRPGRYAIAVAYVTDRLIWDAAYTMTTTPARDRAVLNGAVAIRNATGLALHGADVRVVDAEIGAGGKAAEVPTTDVVAGKGVPQAKPRALGRVDLDDGETRVELVPGAVPRAMRSVLVYDPIGTKLDLPSSAPSRDPSLGVRPPATTHVIESFEVERDERAAAGLPAGPVRLLERRADGSLVVLGESRLFDTSTRVAAVDTIAVGTADGVTAHRERSELTIDDDNKRLVEEFAIEIDNARPAPARVVIREHMYRGLNWHLAYPSAPIAEKEGDQQIALHVTVPAHGKAKQVYVVVYTWDR